MAITVAGAGPGNPDYILPAVLEKIRTSPVVAVSERIKNDLKDLLKDKELIPLGSGVPLSDSLERILGAGDVLVLVSGDPLFYSLFSTLKKKGANPDVLPGISSLQYLFSKVGLSMEGAKLMSLHGRDEDVESFFGVVPLGLLLSGNLSQLAVKLEEAGIDEVILGENLSYSNERITRMSPRELKTYENAELSVLIVPQNHGNTTR